MDARHLSPPSRNVNRVGPAKAISLRKRERRHRLIAEAVRRHGVPALVGLLLESLEAEFGDALRVDARLEHLIDVDPRAIALLEASR